MLPILLPLVVAAATAAPAPIWPLDEYMDLLPLSVQSFINKTYAEGRDVWYDVYDDLKENLLDPTEEHVDEILDLIKNLIDQWISINEEGTKPGGPEGSIIPEEEAKRKEVEVKKILEKLRALQRKIQTEEKSVQYSATSLRDTLLQLIMDLQERFLLKDLEGEIFDLPSWNMRILVARMKELLADSSQELKQIIQNISTTLNQFNYTTLGTNRTIATSTTTIATILPLNLEDILTTEDTSLVVTETTSDKRQNASSDLSENLISMDGLEAATEAILSTKLPASQTNQLEEAKTTEPEVKLKEPETTPTKQDEKQVEETTTKAENLTSQNSASEAAITTEKAKTTKPEEKSSLLPALLDTPRGFSRR